MEGISERVNSRGKNRSLEHRVPEGVLWEIELGLKLCWGLNYKSKYLALILNEKERVGRVNHY